MFHSLRRPLLCLPLPPALQPKQTTAIVPPLRLATFEIAVLIWAVLMIILMRLIPQQSMSSLSHSSVNTLITQKIQYIVIYNTGAGFSRVGLLNADTVALAKVNSVTYQKKGKCVHSSSSSCICVVMMKLAGLLELWGDVNS
ncbi:hypothetical protein Ancab_026904 [Ancistrocladus abbreviatus]